MKQNEIKQDKNLKKKIKIKLVNQKNKSINKMFIKRKKKLKGVS